MSKIASETKAIIVETDDYWVKRLGLAGYTVIIEPSTMANLVIKYGTIYVKALIVQEAT